MLTTPQHTTMNYTLMLPLDFKSKFQKNFLVNQGDFGIRLTFVLNILEAFQGHLSNLVPQFQFTSF